MKKAFLALFFLLSIAMAHTASAVELSGGAYTMYGQFSAVSSNTQTRGGNTVLAPHSTAVGGYLTGGNYTAAISGRLDENGTVSPPPQSGGGGGGPIIPTPELHITSIAVTPGVTSALITVTFSEPTQATLLYGTATPAYATQDTVESFTHTFEMSPLTPNTSYVFSFDATLRIGVGSYTTHFGDFALTTNSQNPDPIIVPKNADSYIPPSRSAQNTYPSIAPFDTRYDSTQQETIEQEPSAETAGTMERFLVTGTVTDATGLPLSDVEILLFTTTTDSKTIPIRYASPIRTDYDGAFSTLLPRGTFSFTAQKTDFHPAVSSIDTTRGQNVITIALTPKIIPQNTSITTPTINETKSCTPPILLLLVLALIGVCVVLALFITNRLGALSGIIMGFIVLLVVFVLYVLWCLLFDAVPPYPLFFFD